MEDMEEHMYSCGTCMDIFLSLIDGQEVEQAGKIIPENFEQKVMSKIPMPKEKLAKNKKKAFNYQFAMYVAAASVTVFLSLSGFYTRLVDTVPRFAMSIQVTNDRIRSNKTNLVADLSNSIVNTTSSFIYRIENIDTIKEER